MDIKKAVKIVEQMENDVESLCKCCMPKGTCCIGCREMAITTILNELKKKDEVIEETKFAIKNDIDGFMTINEHGESNDDILELLEIYLDILEDKEVE